MEFAGKALNIDKNYAKVYVRRARLYRSLGQRANALADCGYAVRLLRGTNDKTLQRLNADLIEDLKAVAESRAEALYKVRLPFRRYRFRSGSRKRSSFPSPKIQCTSGWRSWPCTTRC